jgi:hypothetical protein
MKLKDWITLFGAGLLLFLGSNVLQNFGYLINVEESSSYQKLHPAFYILILFGSWFIFMNLKDPRLFTSKGIELKFLFFYGLLICYMTLFHLSGAFSFIPNTLILPILFSLVINPFKEDFIKKLRILIIVFFITNSAIAIIEMLLKASTFPMYTVDFKSIQYFRSTALQNHPLNNALITSTIMSFILISNLKDTYKYILFTLGLISIVCFGARSSILTWCVLLPTYFLFYRSKHSGSPEIFKIGNFVIVLIGVTGVFFLIMYTSFGERLIEHAYFDDSANVRLKVFNLFKESSFKQFLWGNSSAEMQAISEDAGIGIVENFWIAWLIRFGVIMLLIQTVFHYLFISKLFKFYNRFDKYFVILVFIFIASTNNSLASYTPAITVLFLCSYAFADTKFKFHLMCNSINGNKMRSVLKIKKNYFN